MHDFSRNLTYALMGSLAALPIGCLVAGVGFGIWNSLHEGGLPGFWPNIALGIAVGFIAILIGILPTFVYGAPAYALVATRFRPSLAAAVAIGALPGSLLLVGWSDLGVLFLGFGVTVAACLHFFACRRIAGHGSNNSFKGLLRSNPLLRR